MRGMVILLAAAILMVPAWSGADTLVVEIEAQVGANPIELGGSLGFVESIRLSGTLEMDPYTTVCTPWNPSFICQEYTAVAFPSVLFDLQSSEEWAGAEVLFPGAYDEPLSISPSSAEVLFSDGTGVLTISTFLPFGVPECNTEGSCTYSTTGGSTGGVTSLGTITMTIEYLGGVPARVESWSTIKAIYR